MNEVAIRIFELADAKFPEQKDFARAIGKSESIVSQWRNDITKSYRSCMGKIAEVLDTTVDYLLTGTPPGQPPYYKQVIGEVCDVDGRMGVGKSGLLASAWDQALSSLSPEALEMAIAYDKADRRAKDMVRLALEPFGLSDFPDEEM